MNMSKALKPEISLGMPVYNGEKFLRKRLESLLNQSYPDFELIISDDGSSDSTSEICKEFAKKDDRIRYIRQEKNMGLTWNFNFVLQEAKFDYFVWVAQDDIIAPEFLEKNINILESNKNFVGSTSKIEQIDKTVNDLDPNIVEVGINKITTLKPNSKYRQANTLTGQFEKKVKLFLKNSTPQIMYGLYKKEQLRKSFVNEKFVGNDWAVVLNLLKYGDINVIDEVLMHVYSSTADWGIIKEARLFTGNLFGIIFPYYPLSSWCVKHLGAKLFLKNLDFFIKLNSKAILRVLIDFVRLVSLRFFLNKAW